MRHVLTGLACTLALTAPALAAPLDPLALYTFETGLLIDDSGNGNTGTNLGGVSLATGSGYDGGTAASFTVTTGLSGIDTGIDINAGVLPVLTMGAWVNLGPGASSAPKVLSHDNGGFDRTLGVDPRGDDAGTGFAAFTGSTVADAPGTAPLNTWVHLAVVYDGSGSALYVDGAVAAGFSDNSSSFDSVFSLLIGGNPGFNEDWGGLIDDVFVYDYALSSAQISSIYTSGFAATAEVPLPAGLPLLLSGFGGLALLKRRKRARDARE